MLKKVSRKRPGKGKGKGASGGRFAIVASRYNARFVNAMLSQARSALEEAGVDEVKVVRVPGAYEIPVVAARLASLTDPGWDAIICLGVILRGETTHAQHIGESVSQALADIQVRHLVPVVHEVLLLENTAQAKARCLDGDHNRGLEAAQTALTMGRVMGQLAG